MAIQDEYRIQIFCLIDDFCKEFEPVWKAHLLSQSTTKGDARKKRSTKLAMSEMMCKFRKLLRQVEKKAKNFVLFDSEKNALKILLEGCFVKTWLLAFMIVVMNVDIHRLGRNAVYHYFQLALASI